MARLPRAPRVVLEVTEEIITDAIARDSSHCLWAEAVKAAVPDASRVSVDIQTIRFTDPTKGLRYVYLTPRTAQIALIQFDQGIKPEPHSVLLRGGHVVASAARTERSKKPLTEAQKKQRKAAHAKAMKALAKGRVRAVSDSGGNTPIPVGGKTPPIAAGKRRAFGLRGLEY